MTARRQCDRRRRPPAAVARLCWLSVTGARLKMRPVSLLPALLSIHPFVLSLPSPCLRIQAEWRQRAHLIMLIRLSSAAPPARRSVATPGSSAGDASCCSSHRRPLRSQHYQPVARKCNILTSFSGAKFADKTIRMLENHNTTATGCSWRRSLVNKMIL